MESHWDRWGGLQLSLCFQLFSGIHPHKAGFGLKLDHFGHKWDHSGHTWGFFRFLYGFFGAEPCTANAYHFMYTQSGNLRPKRNHNLRRKRAKFNARNRIKHASRSNIWRPVHKNLQATHRNAPKDPKGIHSLQVAWYSLVQGQRNDVPCHIIVVLNCQNAASLDNQALRTTAVCNHLLVLVLIQSPLRAQRHVNKSTRVINSNMHSIDRGS